LLDVVYREDTLWNVIQCVVRNAKSVILTAVFAVIIIYLFAICGYLFIQDDFLMEVQTKTFAIDNQNINLTIKNKTDLLSKLNKEDRFFRNALYVFYC
jgi:hypothetical protein